MQFDILAINIFFSMVSALLIIFYLYRDTFEYKRSTAIIFTMTFGIVNGTLTTKISSFGDLADTIKPIMLLIVSILIVKFLLKLRLVKSIVVFSLLMIGMGIGNALGLLILGPFIHGDIPGKIQANPLLYILTNIFVTGITILFLYILKPLHSILKQIITSRELAITLLLTFIVIIANSGLYYYVKVFNFAAFFIITILTLIYCVHAIFNGTIIYKRSMEKIEKEQQDFYNLSLENTLFSLRRFKHDWTNNLAVLNIMASMGKLDEIKEYIHEIADLNETNDTSIMNIKNAGLFGIISAKRNAAQDKGITMKIKGIGEIETIPGIKISELCEIVGIFLDNAIEETEKSGGSIEFEYKCSEKMIELAIRNTCLENINITISSKGEGRGNGLKIVEQIIGKYKNIKNFRSYEAEEKIFEQLLVVEKN